MGERPEKYAYSYIGRKPCGCLVAAYVDMSADGKQEKKNLARVLGDWAVRGLTIERVHHSVVRESFTTDCPHKPEEPEQRQKSLFGETP